MPALVFPRFLRPKAWKSHWGEKRSNMLQIGKKFKKNIYRDRTTKSFKPKIHMTHLSEMHIYIFSQEWINKMSYNFEKNMPLTWKKSADAGAFVKQPCLPNPVALVKSLDHGTRMFRHESHQQLQHIHEVVILWDRTGSAWGQYAFPHQNRINTNIFCWPWWFIVAVIGNDMG